VAPRRTRAHQTGAPGVAAGRRELDKREYVSANGRARSGILAIWGGGLWPWGGKRDVSLVKAALFLGEKAEQGGD